MALTVRVLVMYIMAALYIVTGTLHFVMPQFYMAIMPHYLPYHLELVYLSGAVEIICGLLICFERTQSLGAWLTIALLIAVCKFSRSLSFSPFSNASLLKIQRIFRWPRISGRTIIRRSILACFAFHCSLL